MINPSRLTVDDVRRLTDQVTFDRGQNYYAQGMVQMVSWHGDKVHAQVAGSKSKPYQLTASFHRQTPVINCSCPYDWGAYCKHGVALLLYLIDHGGVEYSPNTSNHQSQDQEDGYALLAETVPQDPVLKKVLKLSRQQTPHLTIGVTVKGLNHSKEIPIEIIVGHNQIESRIKNINDLITPVRHFIPSDVPLIHAFSNKQRRFLNVLDDLTKQQYSNSYKPSWKIKPSQFGMLLDDISQSPGISIRNLKAKQEIELVSDPPLTIKVTIRNVEQDQIAVKVNIVDEQGQVYQGPLFYGHGIWLFDEAKSRFCVLHPSIERWVLDFFYNNERVLHAEDRQYFIAQSLPYFRTFAVIEEEQLEKNVRIINEFPVKSGFKIDLKSKELRVTVVFDYAGFVVNGKLGNNEPFYEVNDEQHVRWIKRDVVEEDKTYQLMKRMSEGFDARDQVFYINHPDKIYHFLSEDVHLLRSYGDVWVSDKVNAMFQSNQQIKPRIWLSSSGIKWFDFKVNFILEGQSIDIPDEIQQQLLSGSMKYIRLKEGKFFHIDQRMVSTIAGLTQGNTLNGRLNLAHMPFVMDELGSVSIDVESDKTIQDLFNELKGLKEITPVPLPKEVKEVLRDYQRHGVYWMAFLKKFHFGGILADEMGLGKTLQALTMMKRDIDAGEKLPNLIVCPTSLVYNWKAEITKFFPSIKVQVIHGKDRRDDLSGIDKAHIVITSYPLLRRDISIYHEHQFNYVVLDEAQHIKNRHTINAQVSKQLNAKHCLALTGTPLENSVADIWSIFDFLMPGFLGDYEHFRQVYEIPITQFKDKERLQMLSRMIMPFMLRRLKKDVIKELPEKIEQVAWCELESTQAKLYASMLAQAKEEAVKAYKNKGFDKSRMYILTLLLRLRQICCHPGLTGIPLKHKIAVSVKTELLKELLLELLSGGHRVLIFSQFVGMLEILKEHLIKEKIVYEYMDGQSQDRQEKVDRFNTDSSVQVFLLSLKVGGVGLNLTGADTVILYEPWWNPAVEQQAIDRTHRFGQQKTVLAYKLIVKGTIEEKILQLQERKRFLMNELVLSDDTMAKKIGWDDIKFLLDIDDTVN